MTFLDEVKARLMEVQKRAQEVTQRLQAVQQEHQSVMQELGSYQKIVEVEARRLALEQQRVLAPNGIVVSITPQPERQVILLDGTETDELNKTETIRELLRTHPSGMTPAQIWGLLKNQVSHRQYIYSVLKRLKDRKQVAERRGKYFFQVVPKAEGVRDDPSIVQ